MKRTRSLALKRESLVDLTPRDLTVVQGAADQTLTLCYLDESWRICSLNCQWTFNTCEPAQ